MSSCDEDTAKAGPDAQAREGAGADGNGTASPAVSATAAEADSGSGTGAGAGAGAGADEGAGAGVVGGSRESKSTGVVEDLRVDVGADPRESDGPGEDASLPEGVRNVSSPSPATLMPSALSSRKPSPGPRALRRGNTFRASTAGGATASASPSGSPNLRSSGGVSVAPRAALPRAGTFKLARGAAPEKKEGVAKSSGGGSVDGAASSAGDSGVSKKSTLPRGQTFRATRPDKIAGARAEGARGRRPLPRAGTFAFGHGLGPAAALAAEQERVAAQARNKSAMGGGDVPRKGPGAVVNGGSSGGRREVCGMCGGCAGSSSEDGGGGGSGAPPWAPERLVKLSPRDREIVLRKVQAKEELGRLDRELREKQLADEKEREAKRNEVHKVEAERAEEAQALADADAGKNSSAEVDDIANIDFEDLDGPGSFGKKRNPGDAVENGVPSGAVTQDSDDLEDNVSQRRNRNVPRRTTLVVGSEEGSVASGGVPGDLASQAPRRGETQEECMKDLVRTRSEAGEGACDDSSCGHCEALEGKVRDLEDQLDVLRGVVALSSGRPGESTDPCSSVETDTSAPIRKSSASWKSKVMNSYFGGASASSLDERSRLKEEVDALRKATDFLFTRLQEADARRVDAAAPRPAPSPLETAGAELMKAAQLD